MRRGSLTRALHLGPSTSDSLRQEYLSCISYAWLY